jgi:sec-independent protein translocase protein TatA
MNGLQTLAWFTDPWTYLIVGMVALLLFGKRLPEVGRSLGKGIAEFKKGLHDVGDELNREDTKPDPPRQRLQPPTSDNDPASVQKLPTGAERPPANAEDHSHEEK